MDGRRQIILVTGNAHKLHEFQAMAPENFNILSRTLNLDEIQSMDVKEIVSHKLREAFKHIGKPVVVEDVSAGLDSLNGLPGPFIKFFEQKLGHEALYKIQLCENDRVTINCIAGYYDGHTMLFGEGVVRGHITAPRGKNGFGFDQVVIPEGYQSTFAEMTTQQKNEIGHRGMAYRDVLGQISRMYTGR